MKADTPCPLDRSKITLFCSNKAHVQRLTRVTVYTVPRNKRKSSVMSLQNSVQWCGLLKICLASTEKVTLPWPCRQSQLTAGLCWGKLIFIDFLGSMIHTDCTSMIKKWGNFFKTFWSLVYISYFGAWLYPLFNKHLLSFHCLPICWDINKTVCPPEASNPTEDTDIYTDSSNTMKALL